VHDVMESRVRLLLAASSRAGTIHAAYSLLTVHHCMTLRRTIVWAMLSQA
jgi:hypothetical protein